MANVQAADLVKKGVAELVRVVAAMIGVISIILGGVWVIGEPAARQYVEGVVDRMGLVHVSDLAATESRMLIITSKQDREGARDDVQDLQLDAVEKALERRGAQIDNIEKLAKEQRDLTNAILLEMRKD